jgi:hypothetical protein
VFLAITVLIAMTPLLLSKRSSQELIEVEEGSSEPVRSGGKSL